MPELYETHCSACGVTARWQLERVSSNRDDWHALDGSSFRCEHWGEHHEASHQAARSKSGRGQVDPVTARRLTDGELA